MHNRRNFFRNISCIVIINMLVMIRNPCLQKDQRRCKNSKNDFPCSGFLFLFSSLFSTVTKIPHLRIRITMITMETITRNIFQSVTASVSVLLPSIIGTSKICPDANMLASPSTHALHSFLTVPSIFRYHTHNNPNHDRKYYEKHSCIK